MRKILLTLLLALASAMACPSASGRSATISTDTIFNPTVVFSAMPRTYEIADIKVTGAPAYDDFIVLGYAGIKVGRSMVLSMTISGALAGLAGVTYYLGYVGSIQPKVLISTGFDAIAVSLLGNNNPFGIVFSTMLITLISKGSTYMKSAAGVDAEIASVITGIILLFSACNAYIKWKMERSRREKTNKTKEDK